MKIIIYIVFVLLVIFASFYFYKNNIKGTTVDIMDDVKNNDMSNTNYKDNTEKVATYGFISFVAPNKPDRPYYVFAICEGKVIWEKGTENITNPRLLLNGGIGTLIVANMKETDFNTGKNYEVLKQKYLGKPVLYIYYIKEQGINNQTSRLIVDINTGEEISFTSAN